jgi:hypothetical protein
LRCFEHVAASLINIIGTAPVTVIVDLHPSAATDVSAGFARATHTKCFLFLEGPSRLRAAVADEG